MQQPCHDVAIVKKDHKGLDLMVLYLWNFTHVNKQPRRRIFFFKIFKFFHIVKFILDVFKSFVNTLCYHNDEDFDILKLWNVLPLEM
jgi:hypothetical protein